MTNNPIGNGRLGVMMAVAVGIIVVFGALGFFGIQNLLDSRRSTVVSAKDEPSPTSPTPDDDSGTEFDPGSAIGADGHYANPRYGYSIDLPDGWESKASDNGDGLTLTSPEHSGEIVVYGTNMWPLECVDAGAATVSGCADARAAALEDEGLDITYRQTKGDWFVVSGSDSQGQGTYERWYLGLGSANVLVVDFPMSEREEFDEITADLSKSLSPGDLSVGH